MKTYLILFVNGETSTYKGDDLQDVTNWIIDTGNEIGLLSITLIL